MDAAEGQGGWSGRGCRDSGNAGKIATESGHSGLSARFFAARSKVGTVDARY